MPPTSRPAPGRHDRRPRVRPRRLWRALRLGPARRRGRQPRRQRDQPRRARPTRSAARSSTSSCCSARSASRRCSRWARPSTTGATSPAPPRPARPCSPARSTWAGPTPAPGGSRTSATPRRSPTRSSSTSPSRDQDLQRNQIVWTNPTPFNNTYAIATTRAFSDQNNIRTTTDWANFINSGNPQATTCVEAEFASRNDGLPNLLTTYGVTRPYDAPPALTVLDTGAIYQATANANPCFFGEVFTTDGRIPALNLVSLADDKNFFPKYNASNTIRKQVVDRNPQVVQVFDQNLAAPDRGRHAQPQRPDVVPGPRRPAGRDRVPPAAGLSIGG